jgi:2-succinyl-5-enolpyruvyl-6-hydroxy-3-cyclohexene-1-carboxylate synthase
MTSRFQPIYDIAAICSGKGIRHAVLSPGSRNAPLILAFSRHPAITAYTVSDERSAGFVALGQAQQSGEPVALVCTSGSAAYNFAPAVAEAFFSNTPLIVFTADRPSEWIAQQDGQTIHQTGLYGAHVKKSFQLPQNYSHPDEQWEVNRIVNDAVNLAQQHPVGPVHINAPFREPLYPAQGDSFSYSDNIRIIHEPPRHPVLSEQHKQVINTGWHQSHNVLIVAGQGQTDVALNAALTKLNEVHRVPVVGDVISNVHGVRATVRHADLFLGTAPQAVKKSLRPDLLISFGGSVVSKNLKLFLREFPPVAHWHVVDNGTTADNFQHLTHVFHARPIDLINYLATLDTAPQFEHQKQENYHKFWEVEERRSIRILSGMFPQTGDLSELELVAGILGAIPHSCTLHLANSMSVRYGNFVGLTDEQSNVRVFANRGTSGIDGCSSTAVGHALINPSPHLLITGDMAFFYDRNAFWHNYNVPNLRIVLLNNHGGVIFNLLDGPANLPETDEYFVTRQELNGRKLCEEFGFDYLLLDNRRKLKNLIKDFLDFDGRTKVLELDTNKTLSKSIIEQLKMKIKESYDA